MTTTQQRKSHVQKMVSNRSTCAFKNARPGKLSVPATSVKLPSFSISACGKMWEKAECLLNTTNRITHAPGT